MISQDNKSSIFIIAGMHRSGTSLTASLMESAGVNIGERLMGAAYSNPKGHFENLDFVGFHEHALRSQGISQEGWTVQKDMEIPHQLFDKAKLIIADNAKDNYWGWKDPRTTLFLDFWKNLLPQAYFIFTYRSPWEVINSLYRRGDEIFYNNPKYALQIWMHYNKIILDFHHQFPDKCILLNTDTVIADHTVISKLCVNKFGIKIKDPNEGIADKSLMNSLASNAHRQMLIKRFFPEAVELYNNLNDQADLKCQSVHLDPLEVDIYFRDWVLQDWLDIYKIKKDSQTELERSQSTLLHTQTELERSQSTLLHTQTELERSQSTLLHTQIELERSQSTLLHTQIELERSQSTLLHTQTELERSQSTLLHTQTELERSQSTLLHTQTELERSQSTLLHTQIELERSQSTLLHTQIELERSQSTLLHTQTELERSQSTLLHTQTELENCQHQLQATQTKLENCQHQLQGSKAELENCQHLIYWMETSKFWKLRKIYLNIKQKITSITNINFSLLELAIKSLALIRKEGYETFNKRALNFLTHKKILGFRAKTTFTETLVTEILQILADSSEYGQWIKEYEPNNEELKKQKNQAFSLNYQPVISVILPVYKLPIAILKETINSVLQQTYTRWELCIAFADISNSDTIQYIKDLSLQDKRIKVNILPENKGISGNSNVSLEMATGEFIALLDHDDLLCSWAFYEVVNKLNKQPDLDFIYSDKDCICANSTIRSRLLLKPEWSPEILYSANYLTHLCIARRELVNSIGGFRPETDGAQDWDLFLRITEQTSRIARINSVLYHWRIIQGSTSLGIDSKPYALEAQLKSVKDHLSRTQLPATITPHPECGFRLQWKTPPPKVSIVIDGEVPWDYLSACISGISVFADPNLHKAKIVLPECNYYSHKGEIEILTEQINLPIDWVLTSQGNSKLATLAEAARQDITDVVLFVSGQIARFQEGWIEELSGWVLNHPDIGFTSALILTNKNIVVEAGLIVDKHGNGFPLFYSSNLYTWEEFGGALWYRNCSASSPWAIAFNYNHYLSIGGLPTDSPSLQHSTIKLCEASRATNKRGLVNPHARVFLVDLPEYNLPTFDDSLANDPYFHPAFVSVIPLKLRSKNGEIL